MTAYGIDSLYWNRFGDDEKTWTVGFMCRGWNERIQTPAQVFGFTCALSWTIGFLYHVIKGYAYRLDDLTFHVGQLEKGILSVHCTRARFKAKKVFNHLGSSR